MLTEEEWNFIMYNGMKATSWYSCIYFVSWMIIGVYVLLNMFLAIVLQNFEQDESRRRSQRSQKTLSQRKSMRNIQTAVPEEESIDSKLNDIPRQNIISLWKVIFPCRRNRSSSKVGETTMSLP